MVKFVNYSSSKHQELCSLSKSRLFLLYLFHKKAKAYLKLSPKPDNFLLYSICSLSKKARSAWLISTSRTSEESSMRDFEQAFSCKIKNFILVLPGKYFIFLQFQNLLFFQNVIIWDPSTILKSAMILSIFLLFLVIYIVSSRPKIIQIL